MPEVFSDKPKNIWWGALPVFGDLRNEALNLGLPTAAEYAKKKYLGQ